MSVESLKLAVITERSVVRNDQSSDIDVAIEVITSKSVENQSIKHAINLCVVIDRSGSMQGDKLEQAKSACVDIYECLGPDDLLTVLAFDDEVTSVTNPQTPRGVVKERIHALATGGSTDLSKGWYLGLLELQTYASDKHINRIILLSDGQANKGEQKSSVLGTESSRARNEFGITTSAIGIGTKFQEDILAALAHESGGRFWYIGEARIEDIIKEEFGGALSVIFERPRIEVELPRGVSIIKELNTLPKLSGSYRLRPIKGNDEFSFALRLRVDPTATDGDKLPIRATMRDGTLVVKQAETILRVGSVEDYVQSAEDLRVAVAVQKHLGVVSGEIIVQQMDAGNIDTMITMLQSQTNVLQRLETSVSGPYAVVTEDDVHGLHPDRSRQVSAALLEEIDENQTLVAIGELMDLLQGAGRTHDAIPLMQLVRKCQVQRDSRRKIQAVRGDMDQWPVKVVLVHAKQAARSFLADYPTLQDELASIIRRLDEQLAHFS